MEIKISDLISLFSLCIAFLAYRHSVGNAKSTSQQIHEVSSNHLRLASDIALTGASQKYVVLISEVSKEFEEIVGTLSGPALRASIRIGENLDKFDTSDAGHPYLRHCFHAAINVVMKAYDPELTYQTGLNLTSRIRFLKFIKDDALRYEQASARPSFLSLFHRKKSQTPEEYVHSSNDFLDNIKELYARIPADKEPDVFSETLEALKEYRELHNLHRPRLEQLENRLDQALKENAFEMFDLLQVPNLGDRFERIRGDIGRYRALYFPEFYKIEQFPIYEGIALSVYAGSIAFIASQHFMWGKTYR